MSEYQPQHIPASQEVTDELLERQFPGIILEHEIYKRVVHTFLSEVEKAQKEKDRLRIIGDFGYSD